MPADTTALAEETAAEWRSSAALTHTIRSLYQHPDLPRWHRSSGRLLTTAELDAYTAWRSKAVRLARVKTGSEAKFLSGQLEAAERYLEAAQDTLAERWHEVTASPVWADVSPVERHLYAALMGLSRRRSPEVLCVVRLACDVVEAMTGRRYSIMDMSRAGARLEHRGILSRKRLRGSTVYVLTDSGSVTKNVSAGPCILSNSEGDTRPELSERDWLVWKRSAEILADKKKRDDGTVRADWEPGAVVAAVDADLDRRAREKARELPDYLDGCDVGRSSYDGEDEDDEGDDVSAVAELRERIDRLEAEHARHIARLTAEMDSLQAQVAARTAGDSDDGYPEWLTEG